MSGYTNCEDWLAAQFVSEFEGVQVSHVYAAWEYQQERLAALEKVAESAKANDTHQMRFFGGRVPTERAVFDALCKAGYLKKVGNE